MTKNDGYILVEKETRNTYNFWSGISQTRRVRLTWVNQVAKQCCRRLWRSVMGLKKLFL